MADVHFFLMYKDDIVTAFVIDDISGAILKISPNENPDLLPLGGRQSADALRKWWLHRAVPIKNTSVDPSLSNRPFLQNPKLYGSSYSHFIERSYTELWCFHRNILDSAS